MANGSERTPGSGETIRTIEMGGGIGKTQVFKLDLSNSTTESLLNGAMPVTDNGSTLSIDDGGGSLTVDGAVTASLWGTATIATGNMTRPNDTTTYAPGDAVNTATSGSSTLTIAAARSADLTGIITGGTLTISTAQSLKADIETWIFNVSITAQNDNGAFAPTDNEMLSLLGVIQWGNVPFVGSGNVVYQVSGINIHFLPISGSASLAYVHVVRNAYVPAAQEVWNMNLRVLRD